MRIFFLIPVLLFLSLSCQQEADLSQPVIDERLKPFFDSFKQEGILRGRDITLANVTGSISDIDTDGVLGRCNQNTSGAKHLIIDSLFWAKSDGLRKEYVIFHELGHCALDRRHLDTKSKEGTCVSMMQSGNGSCKLNYHSQNRKIYLDELFSQ